MGSPPKRRNAMITVAIFGIIPCILGLAIGQFLRLSNTIWLSDAGGFWPLLCFAASVTALMKRSISSFSDRTIGVFSWLVITWTWLYFPLWSTATEIPQSSALTNEYGRVSIASEWARQPTDTVWLLAGRAGNRIVSNVAGKLTIHSVEVQYRYDERYIATRRHDEDIGMPVVSGVRNILAIEVGKSRTSRIALFETREVHDRLLSDICRTVVPDSITCPLKLKLSREGVATAPGEIWSKQYTEKEAIDEQHLPTLVQLLTTENARPINQAHVFASFMEFAVTADDLAKVGRKPRMLNEEQFDELFKRILGAPGCNDEVVSILINVNRLTRAQRLDLRAKVFREASMALIVKHIVPLRMSDAEVTQLSMRMRVAFEKNPDVAVLALESFGERLPREAQLDAVRAIVNGKASFALAALRQMTFSEQLRGELLTKIVTDGSYDDFSTAQISREKLEDMLTPSEMRQLIETMIRKSESSAKWLRFSVQTLPLRWLTLAEHKSILNGLLFESTKSGLEYASENRNYLDATDVNEITKDYTRTITPDLCLHLSHRNKIRGTDYFSESQLQIFRACAQSK